MVWGVLASTQDRMIAHQLTPRLMQGERGWTFCSWLGQDSDLLASGALLT